jgi:hypothetical protein
LIPLAPDYRSDALLGRQPALQLVVSACTMREILDYGHGLGISLRTANIGYSQTPISLRFAVLRTAGYP